MNKPTSLAHMLREWARASPDKTAVAVDSSRALTFSQLHDRTSRFANALLALGAMPGDRVAFLGRDPETWVTALVGASKIRASGIALNWRLAQREVLELVADADPVVTVCEASMLPLMGLAAGTPGEVYVVKGAKVVELEEWLAPHSPEDTGIDPAAEDVAFIFYTSGTTGRPKGVQLTNANIAANLAKPTPFDVGCDDVLLIPSPLFHISGTGFFFLCLARGATALFVTEIVPANILALINAAGVTYAAMVPAVIQMLAREPSIEGVSFPSLKMIIYGGSPISTTLMKEARAAFDSDLAQGYGMTETNGPISFLWPEDHSAGAPEHRLASAGRPVDGIDVGVFDPVTDESLPPHQVGEVRTRSDLVMLGYRNRPDEQAAAFVAGDWFRTGDAGFFDEDGYLYITDRIKDMIVTGGENVFPAEVENVLMAHPAVAEAAVIGVPSDRWGETVRAVIVARSGHSVTPDELIAFSRDCLAHYKCPTGVDVVESLPRNATGKVQKVALRQQYWPVGGRQIN
ncbi:long-chain-fatty-acid--CoA ligase [Prescottella subtropica]|uniref:long-chain-fatty-acid--CoA ligase n=1 Tax=Prescottella subtropica TaxID=2545757 RepID=UPI0010FA3E34|nr:long-chain-fatty-acid--CoA ligase [Prescottella subtropica]